MPVNPRRGFTLADLLVGIVLLGLVATLCARMVLSFCRQLRAEQERAGVETGFDVAMEFLGAELADVAPGDLRQVGSDSLVYRASRSTGIACRVSSTAIDVLRERLFETRLPQPGRDSLLLYMGREGTRDGVDDWVVLPLLGVGSGSCGGRPSLRLATLIDTSVIRIAALPPLNPIRSFEVMQARLYRSLGTWWLGARSVSAGEGIQPLAGPFEPNSVMFGYRDSSGLSTGLPESVRSIQANLTGSAIGWNGRPSPQVFRGGILLTPANLRP